LGGWGRWTEQSGRFGLRRSGVRAVANRGNHVGSATFPRTRTRPIFGVMAKSPPKKPKDPAKPTRAKAARPDQPPTPDTLANLLNPAIKKGTAGLGSGTGLQPPPDNSWDRRRDFSEAHRARKSTPKEVNEAPQADFEGPPGTGLGPRLVEEPRLFGESK